MYNVDVSRFDPQTFKHLLCKLRCPAVPVPVGQDHVEVIRLERGRFQKILYQLRCLVPEYRTHDPDPFIPVGLIPVMDRLSNTDKMVIQGFCCIQAVSCSGEVENHCSDHSFLL